MNTEPNHTDAKTTDKLISALTALKTLQDQGQSVFQSNAFGRTHRERLLKHGFLKEIIKGWLMVSHPDERPGDTTAWFASFWEFCQCYATARFGADWHLSPEQSALIHAGETAIPRQVIIYSPKGANNALDLLAGTSLFDLKHPHVASTDDVDTLAGLRLYSKIACLIKLPQRFYQHHPISAEILLKQVADDPELLKRLLRALLHGGHGAAAERLAGAYLHLGLAPIHDEILSAMKAIDVSVRVQNPFQTQPCIHTEGKAVSPSLARLQALWATHRQTVIDVFPKAPGKPNTANGIDCYLQTVESGYALDAYHSLSIEGYRVTHELIEAVRLGAWSPQTNSEDGHRLNALAARGYWLAFEWVKADIQAILQGQAPSPRIAKSHQEWYRALFQPSVAMGLVRPEALAGYRHHPVYIRQSRHIPPRAELVGELMSGLFDLMDQEPEASVKAVLGHWLFGFIHPYPDGNGRMARFLMNAMLASEGYPWVVVRVEDRSVYMAALEAASVDNDLRPFAEFITHSIARP
ncbi:MAG TPA: Fic family protein [Wenzhouxiangella sp.]